MCNRTDCAGVWAGPLACSVCRERDMGPDTSFFTRLEDANRAIGRLLWLMDEYSLSYGPFCPPLRDLEPGTTPTTPCGTPYGDKCTCTECLVAWATDGGDNR